MDAALISSVDPHWSRGSEWVVETPFGCMVAQMTPFGIILDGSGNGKYIVANGVRYATSVTYIYDPRSDKLAVRDIYMSRHLSQYKAGSYWANEAKDTVKSKTASALTQIADKVFREHLDTFRKDRLDYATYQRERIQGEIDKIKEQLREKQMEALAAESERYEAGAEPDPFALPVTKDCAVVHVASGRIGVVEALLVDDGDDVAVVHYRTNGDRTNAPVRELRVVNYARLEQYEKSGT